MVTEIYYLVSILITLAIVASWFLLQPSLQAEVVYDKKEYSRRICIKIDEMYTSWSNWK